MKPIDRFSYLKNNRVSQDTSSLVQCYLPIIGQEALSLYLYTISFWDNGRKEYLFSSILNHLNFGMDRLLKSLKILSAFNLLTLYQKGDVYQLASILHFRVRTSWNILVCIADFWERNVGCSCGGFKS